MHQATAVELRVARLLALVLSENGGDPPDSNLPVERKLKKDFAGPLGDSRTKLTYVV